MISNERREMFSELYRMAEYYENPQFKAGDIDGNAEWFNEASEKYLVPFLIKHNNELASDLAFAIVDEASRKAAAANKMEQV